MPTRMNPALIIPILAMILAVPFARAEEPATKLGQEFTHDYVQPVKQNRGGATGSGIQYVTETIPPIKAPAPKGKYYPATIPDTLDLAERCALAVHGITCCTDPLCDYEIYGSGASTSMGHSYHDYNGGQPKWLENLPLLRNASGSRENMIVDQKMMETFFRMLGPDGLYWIPVQGSPWQGATDPNQLSYFNPRSKQVFNSWPTGRALMTLCAWYRWQGDPIYKDAIINMVKGLENIAVPWGDGAAYIYERRVDNDILTTNVALMGGIQGSCNQTSIMNGLASAYKTLGHEPARDLNKKLFKFVFDPANHMYLADGSWAKVVHFHGQLHGIMGMLDQGLAARDPQWIETAKKYCQFARDYGQPLIGWFPEGYENANSYAETCQVADMTIFAVKLAEAGVLDAWEDVEHYTRNHLQSAQIVDNWWMQIEELRGASGPANNVIYFDANKLLVAGAEAAKPLNAVNAGTTLPLSTSEAVAERVIGTFPGYTEANGMKSIGAAVSCCTGNGARALYFAWRHIVDEKDGVLKVNLLLNRASKWADVDSCLPYTGEVKITMKTDKELAVRIPSWVKEGEAKCSVNEQPKSCAMDGRYLQVGAVKAGDKVTVTFPLRREIRQIQCKDLKFTIDLKGFNAVDIWPRVNPPKQQVLFPFYTRADYRENTPRFKQVTRFAPDREIEY